MNDETRIVDEQTGEILEETFTLDAAFPPNVNSIKPKAGSACRLWLDVYATPTQVAQLVALSNMECSFKLSITPA